MLFRSELVGIVSLPFADDRAAVFAKGGVHRLKTETSIVGVGSDTERKTDGTWGAGVKFDFNKNVSVRGEWERFKVKNNDSFDTDLVSASLVFHFK